MQMTLKDIRAMAAMAQFSVKELRRDILLFIEQNEHLAGETVVSVDADSVRVLESQKDFHG
jgi:hypothetical protein